MAKQLGSFIALVNYEGEVLTIQRSRLVKNPELWGLPGGRLDEGENVIDAGARELKEELGIIVNPWLHGHLTVRAAHRTHVTFLPWTPTAEQASHVNHLCNGRMVSDEVMAVKWRTRSEIGSMLGLHRSLELFCEKSPIALEKLYAILLASDM